MSPRDVRANAMAMRDLVDPVGLGGFKVLIQEKGTGLGNVERLLPSPERVEQLPMPLLRTDHVPLYEGGYPPGTVGVQCFTGGRMSSNRCCPRPSTKD